MEAIKNYYSNYYDKIKVFYDLNQNGVTLEILRREAENKKAVENALHKMESLDQSLKKEADKIFSYFYENDRRNINAVSMKFYLSPSSIYRRLNYLRKLVSKELEKIEKTKIIRINRG